MGKRTRILLFILVNIVVSAAATLIVLWLWERAHPRPEVTLPALSETSNDNSTPQRTIAEESADSLANIPFINESVIINIRTIVGAGDLQNEYVEIVNQGQNPADLSGFRLIDETGREFTFPALILNGGGAIKVLSKAGTNTVIELYWQSDSPVWQSGETARLLNPNGDLVSSYTIP